MTTKTSQKPARAAVRRASAGNGKSPTTTEHAEDLLVRARAMLRCANAFVDTLGSPDENVGGAQAVESTAEGVADLLKDAYELLDPAEPTDTELVELLLNAIDLAGAIQAVCETERWVSVNLVRLGDLAIDQLNRASELIDRRESAARHIKPSAPARQEAQP